MPLINSIEPVAEHYLFRFEIATEGQSFYYYGIVLKTSELEQNRRDIVFSDVS